MVADAALLQGGVRADFVRADFVRRMVGYRLPVGSLVADVAWHPDSCLVSFTDEYATLAVTAAPTLAARAPVGTRVLRAGPAHLALADATVDCVLLLDVVARPHGGHDPLTEARRVLRPGGLAVLSAPVAAPTSGVAGTGPGNRRQAGARLVAMLGDLGLVPEQVHHLQSLLHPASLVTRVRSGSRARSDSPRPDHTEPWLCRMMAAVNRLDQAKLARLRAPRSSAVIALGRKP